MSASSSAGGRRLIQRTWPAGLVLLAVLAAACGDEPDDDLALTAAERIAADASPAQDDPRPEATDEAPRAEVPALEGRTIEEARGLLEGFGAPVQVVEFEADSTVSTTYPETGEAVPRGEALVIWLGSPPDPPVPEPTPEAEPAPEPEPGAVDSGEESGDEPAGSTGEAEGDNDREAADGDGDGDGSADAPADLRPGAPQPSRTSPRRMPSAEPGTVLEGPASWYGPGFDGRTTACGGRYDSSELTLATRELRCGTRVLITHPSGATIEATATDWGPAEWTGRRFDLSRATFEALAPLSRGVVRVTVEVID